jgi:predicted permease
MAHEWLTEAWLRVKALARRRRLERDLEEELQFHLAKRAEKNLALGLGSDDAGAAARRRFGNVSLVKEDCREHWTFTWMETVWQDTRYAARTLAKSPGFVAVVVFSLMLGIGANVSVFSVMNTVMLRALPYPHPEQLMAICPTSKEDPKYDDMPPLAEIADWKKANQVFENIAAVGGIWKGSVTGAGEPVQVPMQTVTADFFAVVGVQPTLGRVFRADEGHNLFQSVVISDGLWKKKFNGDPGVLGKTFRIEGVVSTVVGVMPAGFEAIEQWYQGKSVDIWMPPDPERAMYVKRTDRWSLPVGRLKEGVALAQAQAQMDVIALALEHAFPESNKGIGEKVVPLYDELYKSAGNDLYPLLGAVGFVLLIGCVNVANLVRSRTESRRKEYSVRASLGAGRRRLMQQLLVESGLLTLIGGALGVLLAFLATHILRAFAQHLPHAEGIQIDGRVLIFAVGLSVLTTLLFGLAPGVRAARPDLNDILREGDSRTVAGIRGHARHILVILEVAMAMLLLVGAGLMVNSLLHVLLVYPGFDPSNILTMAVNLPEGNAKYTEKVPGKNGITKSTPQAIAFHKQLLETVAAMPGVESAGMITIIPPLGAVSASFSIVGQPVPSREDRPYVGFNEVSPNFFHTMRIPLLKGRYLDNRDTENAPWTIVINESMAKRYFPNEDPIGQQLLLRLEPDQVDEERPRQVVGIVADVKHVGIGGMHPLFYESYLQYPQHLYGTLVIRTASDVRAREADLTASVKQVVRELDADQPVTDISTMDEVLRKFRNSYQYYVITLGIFAGMAVLLAMIGVYGVLSYFVNQRTREMGIRLALGAQRGDLLRMVARLGLKLSLTGAVIGIALALGLNRYIAEHFWIYHVKSTDPFTYAAVTLVLVSTALLACYIPARRATNVDPMTALRHD